MVTGRIYENIAALDKSSLFRVLEKNLYWNKEKSPWQSAEKKANNLPKAYPKSLIPLVDQD